MHVDVQIHRRIAFSLASTLLAVLAVPLGIRPVRSGRSAGALTAIGVMLLYWGLFIFAESAGSSGWLPPAIAMWTPNLVVTVIGLWLVHRSTHSDA